MMVIRNYKLILALVLVLLLVDLRPMFGQGAKTFTGKITAIAKGTELDISKRDIFYVLQLDEYPNIKFRLSPEDAVRFGVIESAGPTGVVTPRMSKGLGWRVKLNCDPKNYGEIKTPVYRVTSLVHLED